MGINIFSVCLMKTSHFQGGGMSGFVHSFVAEVLAIIRAHVTALGGNALVAFFLNECVILNNPHKNHVSFVTYCKSLTNGLVNTFICYCLLIGRYPKVCCALYVYII